MILSCVFGLIWLAGESLRLDNTFISIYQTPGQCVKSVIYFLGASYLIFEGAAAFYHLMFVRKEQNTELFQNRSGKFISFVRRHVILSVSVLMVICWSVPIFSGYPVKIAYDEWEQLFQFFGYNTFTSHFPPVETVLLGLFVQLGIKLGNANIGIVICTFLQVACYAAAIGYAYQLMIRLKTPIWLKTVSLFIAGFSPYFSAYVSMILKDTLYSVAILLLVIETIYALMDLQTFLRKAHHYVLTFVSMSLIFFFRKNGPYVLYLTIAICLICLIVKRKSIGRQAIIKITAFVLATILIVNGISLAVSNRYVEVEGSIAEALSLPIQQTARTVSHHTPEITEEEKASINLAMEYDLIDERYNPVSSDPIKLFIWKSPSNSELFDYLKTWFKMFFKYPATYFAATLNQNYYFVYPFVENDKVFYNVSSQEKYEKIKQDTHLEIIVQSEALLDIVRAVQRMLFSLPVVGVLFNGAFNNIVMLFSILIAILKSKKKYLLASIPVFLTFVVAILGPTYLVNPRYIFPIIYSLPVLIAFLRKNDTDTLTLSEGTQA